MKIIIINKKFFTLLFIQKNSYQIQMLINEDYVNRRIDKYLRDEVGYLQSKICVLAKQKKILVNGNPQNFNYRLQKGDKIDVLDELFKSYLDNHFLDRKKILNSRSANYEANGKNSDKNQNFKCKDFKQNKTKILQNNQKLPVEMVYKIKQSVVFENDDIVVINKPYGISVQGGTGVKYSLEDYFHLLSEKKLRIVHRIDKDTRGLLILAKNVPIASKLTEMFRKREVHKKYLAVLSGIPIKKSGTIKTYIVLSNKDNIAKNAHSSEERMNGKEAITKYKVLKTNDNNNTSLVEFFPITGRKHQIRLHSQHIKCPIVGDEKYGFEKTKNKKLQLFAVEIDASPIIKIKLEEKDLKKMIDFDL